jgi:hypothetical protein
MTPLSEKELIAFLNERFALILNPGVIYDTVARQPISKSAFTLRCGSKRLDGKAASKIWLESPEQRTYESFLYDPSAASPPTVFNTHYGMAVSRKGSVALWTRLLDSLYGENTPERRYAEAWDLYPIAHPGAKLRNARLVWSDVRGVGKGAEAKVLSYVYGSHNCSLAVDDQQLNSKFNVWLENKQLVVIPESNLTNKKLMNRLNDYITNPDAHFEGKYLKGYDGPTCANYLFHSNDADAIRIANADRRYHVHHVVGEGLKRDRPFWLKLLGPTDHPGGWAKANAGALRYHAEHFDFEAAGFDPFALAPETEAKVAMIEDTGTPLENWVTRLKNDSKEMLRGHQFRPGPFRMATTQALMIAYGGKVNANLMVRTLREAGIEKVVPKDLDGGSAGRNQLRIGNKLHTVWALEPGIKMTADEIRKAYYPLTELEHKSGTGWSIRELKDWSKL